MKKKEMIINWLKENKINYVNYNMNNNIHLPIIEVPSKFKKVLNAARINYFDLEANEFYFIKTVDNNINIDHDKPKQHRQNFKNFNLEIHEYFFDIAFKYSIFSNLNSEIDDMRKKATVLSFFSYLRNQYTKKNKYVDKHETLKYSDLFLDIPLEELESYQTNFLNNISDIDDLFSIFLNKFLDKKYNKLQEIGLFYPVKINHDILENKHYLFEINYFKFSRKNSNLENLENNFRSDLNEPISNEDYLLHVGMGYTKECAYFNPFILLEDKNIERYGKLLRDLNYNQNNFFKVLELLNQIQFSAINIQHENLINSLYFSKGKTRSKTLKEAIDQRYKKILEIKNDDIETNITLLLLYQMSQKLSKTNKYSNVNIDFFTEIAQDFKSEAEYLLNDIKYGLQKSFTLKDHYNECINKIKVLSQELKFIKERKESKIFLCNIVTNIFTFNKNEKINKNYNSEIKELYLKYVHRDIEELIYFDYY